MCIAKEINFKMSVEDNLEKGKISEIKTELTSFLEKLTAQKSKMAVVDQSKSKALIMDCIHNVMILDELTETRCKS